MPELITNELGSCLAKLKPLLHNAYAVERYTIMKSPNYTHPGWVEREAKLRGAVYGRLKNNAR